MTEQIKIRISPEVAEILSMVKDYMNGDLISLDIDNVSISSITGNEARVRVSEIAHRYALECNLAVYGGSVSISEIANRGIIAQCKTIAKKPRSNKRNRKITLSVIASTGIMAHCKRIIAYHNRSITR